MLELLWGAAKAGAGVCAEVGVSLEQLKLVLLARAKCCCASRFWFKWSCRDIDILVETVCVRTQNGWPVMDFHRARHQSL